MTKMRLAAGRRFALPTHRRKKTALLQASDRPFSACRAPSERLLTNGLTDEVLQCAVSPKILRHSLSLYLSASLSARQSLYLSRSMRVFNALHR